MADENDERDSMQQSDQTRQQPTDQRGEFGRQGQQSQAEREQAGQSPLASPGATSDETSGGTAIGTGQPLGGNDSNTGTGTTLSQGYESSSTDTLTQSNSSQDTLGQNAGGGSNFSDTDQQGSSFIGAQGTGSDDYLQTDNPELSREDLLNQEDDGGMGTAASQQQDEGI